MDINKFIEKTGAEFISSRSNRRVIEYSKLRDEKARDEMKLFLAEGVKLSREALRHVSVHELLISESAAERTETDGIAALASEKGIKITVLADAAFEKISTEKAPQGVIAVVDHITSIHTRDNFSEWQKDKRLIMLDEIRDPGNLGTIIRSAEALGIDGIVLSGCADIYNSKTVRAAMGALFRMPVYISQRGEDTVREMKDLGRRVIGATLGENTVTLGKYGIERSDCIVIGNEGHGISDAVVRECTMCVKIPMAGETESLNASAAAVCIMWEYFRQLN